VQGKDQAVADDHSMDPRAWLNPDVPRAIFVDAEGDWYYQGNKIIRPDILEFFCEHLGLDADGNYLLEWQQTRCLLGVEDTPLVITRVDKRRAEASEQGAILLMLKHLPAQELLDPASLVVGKDNVLYCKVRSGQLPARFSRPAYYQLAEWIEEDPETGDYYLELNNHRYVINLRGL
jgi:uncharacterized protein